MLFRPNIVDPAQLAALVGALRAAAPPDAPLLVVHRSRGGHASSGCARRRRSGRRCSPWARPRDPSRTAAVGRALGEELAALGLAGTSRPCSTCTPTPPTRSSAIARSGPRPRRSRPPRRSRSGAGCGARAWSAAASTSPATATRAPTRITSCPWSNTTSNGSGVSSSQPFAAAARAGMEAFMTAHVVYPGARSRPAPRRCRGGSPTELLRGELGFTGVLVSDDLGMKAVADRYPIEDLAVAAIEAGVDHLLVREPARAPGRGVRGHRPRRREARTPSAPGSRRARRAWPFSSGSARSGRRRRARCSPRCSGRPRTGRSPAPLPPWRRRPPPFSGRQAAEAGGRVAFSEPPPHGGAASSLDDSRSLPAGPQIWGPPAPAASLGLAAPPVSPAPVARLGAAGAAGTTCTDYCARAYSWLVRSNHRDCSLRP